MTEPADAPKWDARVRNRRGKPVPQYRPRWSKGWFVIRRADGEAGVELETRIPGYLSQVTGHDDQAAAEAAARQTWREYASAVAGVTGQEPETEPWAA